MCKCALPQLPEIGKYKEQKGSSKNGATRPTGAKVVTKGRGATTLLHPYVDFDFRILIKLGFI